MSSRYRARLWLGIGTSVLIGSTPAAAGARSAPEPALRPDTTPAATQRLPLPHRWDGDVRWERLLAKADGKGGEGGEGGEGGICDLGRGPSGKGAKSAKGGKAGGEGGEGGEGGGKAANAGFARGQQERLLVCLALMEGHLRSGLALYQAGEQALAATHFAHPAAEVYEGIEHALERYRTPDLEAELAALHKLSLSGAPVAQVEARQAQVLAALQRAATAVSADRGQPGVALRVALTVLQQAAHEYEEAVEGGTLSNPIEYQDARGFVIAAQGVVAQAAQALGRQDRDGLARLQAVLDELVVTVREVRPDRPKLDAAGFSSAVARVELAASSLADLYGGR